MTRAREKGENEITVDAKRQALRTGDHVCVILARMLRIAKKAHDLKKQKAILQAQKFLGCRNKRKRKK